MRNLPVYDLNMFQTKLQKMKKNNYMENMMYGNQLFGGDENGEMKPLRASPPKLEDDLTMEPNHNVSVLL